MTSPRLGVIGGGQLARMMAGAAAELGVPFRVLAEAPDASAAQVAPHVVGDHTDLADLRAFGAALASGVPGGGAAASAADADPACNTSVATRLDVDRFWDLVVDAVERLG